MAHRWKCPICDAGVLLGARPRKNATARYCLPCSEETGSLVERTCPALETVRGRRAERRKVKAKRDRVRNRRQRGAAKEAAERRREARLAGIVEAVGDMQSELERLWPVVAVFTTRNDLPMRFPALKLRRGSRCYSTGRAYPFEHRVVMTFGNNADHPCGQALLLHELVHLVLDDREWHGPSFWHVCAKVATQVYEAEVTGASLMQKRNRDARHIELERSIRRAKHKREG